MGRRENTSDPLSVFSSEFDEEEGSNKKCRTAAAGSGSLSLRTHVERTRVREGRKTSNKPVDVEER